MAVNMPGQHPEVGALLLLHIYKNVGDRVDIGERLFAYEADGAVFFENSTVAGAIERVFAVSGDVVEAGKTVMLKEIFEDGKR